MADQRLSFRRIPLRGADKTADFFSVPVQQDARRQPENTGIAAGFHGFIVARRKVPDVQLLEKACYLFHALKVLTDGQNLEIVTAHFPLQPVKARHFLAAGRAPGGPEIDEHDLAAMVGKRLLRSLAIQEGEILEGARCLIGGEILHLAGQQRVQIFRESC